MDKPLFSEAIKVKDGVFYNMPFHQRRMNRTAVRFYGRTLDLELSPQSIPTAMRTGLYKCRVEYSDRILRTEFIPYSMRVIRSMALVEADTVEYAYKFLNRDRLNELWKQSGSDEIILLKDGCVTDSSSSNLVFRDNTGFYTPDTFLLPGTKREFLLQKGIISPRRIRRQDLHIYQEVYLINAMIDLEDRVSFPVHRIDFRGEEF